MSNRYQYILLFLLLCLPVHTANAIEWSGSGFGTWAVGRLSADSPSFAYAQNYQGPVYIADYGQAGIYENNGWSMRPDSRLGFQGMAKFDTDLEFSAQVVSRGTQNGNLDLEWAYGSYQLADALTLHLGRKRLPLFYYSDAQDVGFTIPWVRLPPQGYGWDVVNYNGISLQYRSQVGGWATAWEMLAGSETRKNNPYMRVYYGKNARINERWSNIIGGAVSMTQDWLELRSSYIQSNWDYAGTSDFGYQAMSSSRQRITSFAAKADLGKWTLFTEFSQVNRSPAEEMDYSRILAVSYHFGKFLLTATESRFRQSHFAAGPVFHYTGDGYEAHATQALTLRYDLSPSSDIKLQLERWLSQDGPYFQASPYGQGNSRMITLSYDFLF